MVLNPKMLSRLNGGPQILETSRYASSANLRRPQGDAPSNAVSETNHCSDGFHTLHLEVASFGREVQGRAALSNKFLLGGPSVVVDGDTSGFIESIVAGDVWSEDARAQGS